MKKIFIFLLLILKIYIVFRITYLLYMTQTNPDVYPISSLTWWIYFLIFDIWLQNLSDKGIKDDLNGSKDS
jgi:hypothetical protein